MSHISIHIIYISYALSSSDSYVDHVQPMDKQNHHGQFSHLPIEPPQLLTLDPVTVRYQDYHRVKQEGPYRNHLSSVPLLRDLDRTGRKPWRPW